MTDPVSNTDDMIAQMSPALDPGTFVFATTNDPDQVARLLPDARALYRETEGVTMILPLGIAEIEDFDTSLPMACITLEVHSSLEGVGLTAAVATALAADDIPCNMVAAFHHDHAFVPADKAERALACLQRQASAR